MASDLNPVVEVTSVKQYSGHVVRGTFRPLAGRTAAVVYIEVAPGKLAAINSLIGQIELQAEECVMRVWNPVSALAGKVAEVHVRVIAVPDAEAGV